MPASVNRLCGVCMLLLLGGACTIQHTATEFEPIYSHRFDNGRWYSDGRFDAKTAYVEAGRLVFDEPGLSAERVLDFTDGFVVPPYCEGHNHNIGSRSDGVRDTSQAYLLEGIFYAIMFGSFRVYRDAIEGELNKPDAVDVVFANNGLTGTGGHPRGLREFLKERFGLYPEFTKETLPDAGYFEADTIEQVREKYQLIRAERPDFVKAMLFFVEEYSLRKDDPDYFGERGLRPDLFEEFVRLAKVDGFRTAVHVESEADMVTAIHAGADIIAHLPSYDADVLLSEETIKLAYDSGVALVTTFSLANRVKRRDPELYESIVEAQRINLRKLDTVGAWLVAGSDNTRATSTSEVDHLYALGAVSNDTLLKMWTWNCARLAYPDRKIGKLADGYEASFLVLDGNPIEDFANAKAIRLRFKDGELLQLDE